MLFLAFKTPRLYLTSSIASKIYKGLQQIPEMSQLQEQNDTANIQRIPQMAQQLPEQFNQVNMPIYPS